MPSSPQWVFDLSPGSDHACLWRGAEVIALPPKAFDLLHYFVRHPDRVVTKDELLDAVWPQTAVTEAVVRRHWPPAQSAGRHGADPPVHCHGGPAGLSFPGSSERGAPTRDGPR